MSKKFKSATCVYCADRKSESRDHIFARQFFLESQRHNLPQVPACKLCNQAKSDLEHYLTAVLPFGGRHSGAKDNLSNMVPKRLANNAALRRRLESGRSRIWTREKSGLLVQTMALPFDGPKLEKLVEFIVKGLVWHHWKVLLGSDCQVNIDYLTKPTLSIYNQLLAAPARDRAYGNPGDNTFMYRGAQGTDNPQVSIWQLSLYGGLTLSDDRAQTSAIGAMTGPKSVFERAELKSKFAATLNVIQPFNPLP